MEGNDEAITGHTQRAGFSSRMASIPDLSVYYEKGSLGECGRSSIGKHLVGERHLEIPGDFPQNDFFVRQMVSL